jgi:hypothetical protein
MQISELVYCQKEVDRTDDVQAYSSALILPVPALAIYTRIYLLTENGAVRRHFE